MSTPPPPTAPSLARTRKALNALRQRKERPKSEDGIPPADRSKPLPLSSGQQRLWFLQEWNTNDPSYHAPLAVSLQGPLNVAALGTALNQLQERHEVLRTRYGVDRGVPHQIIDPPHGAGVDLREVSAHGLSDDEARSLVSDFVRQPIDLRQGPVMSALLIARAPQSHILALNLHHIATDGWSTSIILRDLVELYTATVSDTAPNLPPLTIQFADYASWQRRDLAGDKMDELVDYWSNQLADAPVTDLPPTRKRPALPSRDGTTAERLLPPDFGHAIDRLVRSQSATPLSVTLAAFNAVIMRWTGADETVVGSILSSRPRPELEHLVGFFSNTVVVRTHAPGNPGFDTLIRHTMHAVMGAQLHQDLPFGTLVERLSPPRDPGRNPYFETCFTLQNAASEHLEAGALSAELFACDTGTARFDLAVQLTEVVGSGVRLWAEYSTELFDAATIERLFDHYVAVVYAAAEDPTVALSDLPLVSDVDRRDLVEYVNRTGRRFGTEQLCLHHLFERQADAQPDAPALAWQGETTSYRELDENANRIAHALLAAGVVPERPVAVLARRGPVIPATLLGVVKSGGAFLPLDPDNPAARWAELIAAAGVEVVVAAPDLAPDLPPQVRVIELDPSALVRHPASRVASGVEPANLAYVIFTSGSTGAPKGVMVEHRSIVNYVGAIRDVFGLGVGDTLLQFANPAFDVSLFDFFASLGTGASLVLAEREALLSPDTLTRLLVDHHVTVVDLPPVILSALDPQDLPDLRALYVGLEAFPGELVNRWRTPSREFHNGYGPTEATVACLDYNCPDTHHQTMPPIGLPLANYTAYVVDAWQNLCPVGVPGELLIGGVGVARGYMSAPGATAERFVPDPYHEGQRLYRTGDLVVRDEDLQLRFLGRIDNQLKIRGLRIEPAEIEHAIREVADPADVAVVADQRPDRPIALVGYVAARADQVLDSDSIRRKLADWLPSHMVPSAVVILPAIPRTGSGKVDRNRLRGLDAPEEQHKTTPPSTATELSLAGVWGELLGEQPTSTDDSFFAMGGTSLTVTQLRARIQTLFAVQLELRDLFLNDTLAAMAGAIEQAEIAAANDDDLRAAIASVMGGAPS